MVTIQLLDFYLQLTLQSKINLYDFYWTLSHLTSNTDDSKVPVHTFHFITLLFLHCSWLNYYYSIATRNSADVFVNSDTSCSSNVVALLILTFLFPLPLLAHAP